MKYLLRREWLGVQSGRPETLSGGAVMDAKQEVERAQVESEATRDQPLPEHVKGERRGRSVVQSVRLPAEAFAAIEEVASGVVVVLQVRQMCKVIQGGR